jgi:hypothetical protein
MRFDAEVRISPILDSPDSIPLRLVTEKPEHISSGRNMRLNLSGRSDIELLA